MRLAARVDANHGAIKDAFEAMGCSVISLAQVGRGVPDLYAALGAVGVLVEVKAGKGKLRPLQERFKASWRGWLVVCRDINDVAETVSKMRDLARGN